VGRSLAISLKLPSLDNNPILLAETRAHKISEFIQKLPFGDPITAATDLIDELQILNSQKVAFTNRYNALEQYRPAAIQIYQELLPHFSGASLPLSKTEQAFADAAVQLWQEFAYGYKFALIDLQNKILNINNSKTTAQVVHRAIHACKEIALVHHLTYKAPPANLWAELHQLYFSAIQQSAEKLAVTDQLAVNNVSSVSLVYMQVLLMALADPQHLANSDIIKTNLYLSNIAEHAEIRPLGLIENPVGVFLVALDGDKPPVSFAKNKEVPNNETDVLLVTLNLARQIHQHLTLLQEGIVPSDGYLPSYALENHYQDLLGRLLKNFGKSPHRVFSRTKKSDGVELAIGLMVAHHLIKDVTDSFATPSNSALTIKPSRWQVLNASAGGYALRKFSSSQASANVGDVVAVKSSKDKLWELAVLRWANINDMSQLDVGLELISPTAAAVTANFIDSSIEGEALLLPEIVGLKQAASLITARGFCKFGDTLKIEQTDKISKIQIGKLVERTTRFERFQFSLI
jgi:cyclic-di-GMP-binding protein